MNKNLINHRDSEAQRKTKEKKIKEKGRKWRKEKRNRDIQDG